MPDWGPIWRVSQSTSRAPSSAEHQAYEAALETLGCRVERLPDAPDPPDAVFVEDTAVVFDDFAIIARPGAESRRAEVGSVVARLESLRPLGFIDQPATLDGGCACHAAERLCGSVRENKRSGRAALASLLALRGIDTTLLQVSGCLHLKSAVTLVDDDTVLINPRWVDGASFPGFRCLQSIRASRSVPTSCGFAPTLSARPSIRERKNGWKRIASPRQQSMPASSPRLKEA